MNQVEICAWVHRNYYVKTLKLDQVHTTDETCAWVHKETKKQRKHYYVKVPPQALQGILVARDCPTMKKLINIAAHMENRS